LGIFNSYKTFYIIDKQDAGIPKGFIINLFVAPYLLDLITFALKVWGFAIYPQEQNIILEIGVN